MRELSEEQRKGVELVTCDGAKWIRSSIEEFLPNAERCVDSFHVVQWATEALDKVRVEAWKEARKENRFANRADDAARSLCCKLQPVFGDNMLGPASPPVARVKLEYIRQVMLKVPPTASPVKVREFLRNCNELRL